MATLRNILYVAFLIWLPVYVTGGNYGRGGYGGAMFSAASVYPIYPALSQAPVNDFSYRSPSYYNYYQPPLSYYPSYPESYTYQRNPIILTNPGGSYGTGSIFQFLFILVLVTVLAPMLITSLTMINSN